MVVSRIVHVSGNFTDTEVFQLGSKYIEPFFFKWCVTNELTHGHDCSITAIISANMSCD